MSKHDLSNVRDFRPLQRRIPARDLNALRDAGLATLREAMPNPPMRPLQLIVKLQEAIAANASGSAKKVYWDNDAGDFAESGEAFDVINMGPVDAAADTVVPVTLGQSHQLFFGYYAAAAGWAGYKHMVQVGRATAWTFSFVSVYPGMIGVRTHTGRFCLPNLRAFSRMGSSFTPAISSWGFGSMCFRSSRSRSTWGSAFS